MDFEDFKIHYERLTQDVGMDGRLFQEAVLWALIEERIEHLTPPRSQARQMIGARDGLKQYIDYVKGKTGREWDLDCVRAHWDRVRKSTHGHEREPIRFEDKLRLFFTSSRECRYCGRGPPEVRLHIDHKEPAALGGGSRIENLQFLCEEDNLSKGAKLRREDFFDRYLC